MVRPLLFLLLVGAASAATLPDFELARYKATLDSTINAAPWEPEAYLARSGYFMQQKDWAHAAEDWLEGHRLWAYKQGESLGIRAPDHAVRVVASVMSAADRAGLDPNDTAERFLLTFAPPDEE